MNKFKNPFMKRFFDVVKPKPKSEKIDAEYWRKIWWSKDEAKKALVNLILPGDNGKPSRVTHVKLENGGQIPVEDISEEQAHEFMKALCPSWAFPKDDSK